jgi:transposase-like protein
MKTPKKRELGEQLIAQRTAKMAGLPTLFIIYRQKN